MLKNSIITNQHTGRKTLTINTECIGKGRGPSPRSWGLSCTASAQHSFLWSPNRPFLTKFTKRKGTAATGFILRICNYRIHTQDLLPNPTCPMRPQPTPQSTYRVTHQGEEALPALSVDLVARRGKKEKGKSFSTLVLRTTLTYNGGLYPTTCSQRPFCILHRNVIKSQQNHWKVGHSTVR